MIEIGPNLAGVLNGILDGMGALAFLFFLLCMAGVIDVDVLLNALFRRRK